ncbi:hypothetical protein ACFTY8_11500 [Streptomyces mirabilis]
MVIVFVLMGLLALAAVAGAWGPPTRVGAPSDITVVELASPQA